MIEAILAELVRRLNTDRERPFSLICGDDFEANVKADDVQFPIVYFDTTSEAFSLNWQTTGKVSDDRRFLLVFLDLTEFEFEAEERAPITYQMYQAAVELLSIARLSEFVRNNRGDGVSQVNGNRVKNFFDVNADGYIVDVEFKLTDQGVNYCAIFNRAKS